MIIEIKDFPKNVSKVVIEFGNSNPIIKTEPLSKESESNIMLDLDSNNEMQVSKEIVELPKIPKKERVSKVADSMQNLKI